MGRRTDGRGRLEHALSEFEAMGATGFSRRAQAELRASGVRLRATPEAKDGELTGQEFQVARLAATGQSNREIAAALFISPKTVEMHLTRVYRKLGLRSRAALARHAAEGALGDVDTDAPSDQTPPGP
ncbi:MAG: helix-turn-helix transcriptional regulator [Actinobacteria bacterium]|nr:helix-turn-helix transcriptional regulator [Actinomycetota bacterium]